MSYFYVVTDRNLPHFIFGTTTSPSATANQFQTILSIPRLYAFALPSGVLDYQFLSTFRADYSEYIRNDGFMNKLVEKFFPEVVDYVLSKTSSQTFPVVILEGVQPAPVVQPTAIAQPVSLQSMPLKLETAQS
jgi:hypothetical protein